MDKSSNQTGQETKYEWDECYRKTAEVDGAGGRIEWDYDVRGNVILRRDAVGATTRWTYNDSSDPTEFVDALKCLALRIRSPWQTAYCHRIRWVTRMF
ncbi:MAG: hypothetical protein IPM54_24310 [Polyangiaceae bacterium]|nr:hypothetical protein [Polyangiaceae bacterium]